MNPADTVHQWPIERLIPYARNSRTHSDAQVAQIAASIREWGWTTPVLVDEDGQIIAGHGRIMAARKLGMAEVPVVIAKGWSDAQKRAYVIADNKLALNAGWDNDLLALEFGELEGLGFDLELTGFSLDEIDALKPVEVAAGLTDEDDVPEAPADPVTRLGDVWVLGRHRLMCGDSTSIDAVEKLMAGQKADLCFTSPPYGNQRDYTTNGISDWDKLMQNVFSIIPMQETGQILVNLGLIHKGNEWVPYWDEWIQWMRVKGWRRFGWYIWDQGPGLPGDWNGRLAPSHEFIFHFNRKAKRPEKTEDCKHAGVKSHGTGLRAKDGECKGYSHNGKAVQNTKIADSVFRVNRHKARGIECEHPAVYPVELPIKAMQMWPGICYEPFSGSGTTIISAEKINRICYAMELSPKYADIAVKRWQDFTGKQATLESTGQTFAEVSNGKASQTEAA